MTSYGDPHAGDYDDGYQPPSPGRAQVPPPAYNGYGYAQDGYQGHQDDVGYGADPGYYAAPASGRASVPVATGRASVPVATGRATVLSPTPSPTAGRATVRPGAGPDLDLDEYDRPKKSALKKKKQTRRQRLIIAGVGVFILLIGGGMIGGSYVYDRVPKPEELKLINNTEVLAADGHTIATLGSERRTEVPMAILPEKIKHTLIAGEDKNFYSHHGVDLWGIARAAWNNLTGGETQGASTITQQYARQVTREFDITYARKVREAIIARKLEDTYTKEEILGFYLNTVYFGRGANGIGAAYEIYFGVPAEQIKDMTIAQAAVLGAVLKQPEGNNGFDPAKNLDNAKSRWEYVLNNMVENQWLTPEERAREKYPAPANPEAPQPGELQLPKESAGATGYTDSGTGFVINYVEKELEQRGVIDFLAKDGFTNWKNAGLRVTTTIDRRVQAALETQLNREKPGSVMSKQRENIVGAGVVIDHKTGRVLAYYGGSNNGAGLDYAGDDVPHPPASSGKIYTVAAAIESKISIKSRWDPTALKKSEGDPINLGNANREGDQSCLTYCTLEEMTVKSFNVPFYNIARKIGPQKVVEMASKAGVKKMWDIDGKVHDTSKGGPFDAYVGFGKFKVTVLEHAAGTATFANHGVYTEPHFVLKVERKNKKTGDWERISAGDETYQGQQAIRRDIADEVTSVLKKIAPNIGRDAAGKTGTWENGAETAPGKLKYPNTNAHAWFTGYTAQMTATIYVGDAKENETPIKLADGKELLKAKNMGSSFPKELWKDFMVQVNKELKLPRERLPDGTGGRIGSEEAGDGVSPTPSVPDCQFPFNFNCPTTEPGDDPPGGGGGGWPTIRPTKSPRPPGED